MKNILEMLRAEHIALKQRVSNATSYEVYESFSEIKEFLFKVHIMTEDLILFPRLLAYRRMPEDLVEKVRRMSADHRLLERLADNLVDWRIHGKEKLFTERSQLFFDTLIQHNNKEDLQIFSREEVSDYPESFEADLEVWEIVKKYGVQKYEEFVKVSDDFLANVLRLRTPFVK